MNARWSLVTYRGGDGVALGALDGDGTIVTVPDAVAGAGLMDVVDDWDRVRRELEGWSPAGGEPVAGAELLAPLLYPRKLICAGANYADHLEEMNIGEIPIRWSRSSSSCRRRRRSSAPARRSVSPPIRRGGSTGRPSWRWSSGGVDAGSARGRRGHTSLATRSSTTSRRAAVTGGPTRSDRRSRSIGSGPREPTRSARWAPA